MASPHQAITAPHTPVIRLAACEPAVVLAGEIVIISAEVSGATAPPSSIEMRIRSARREIIAEGSLTPKIETEPFRYAVSWTPPAQMNPGAYDVLLRLPGAEHATLITLTLLTASATANLQYLQQALQFRMQARLKLESGNPVEAVALLERAIEAYESASEPATAAQAMLDAAGLYANLFAPQKAVTLYQRALNIREAAGDRDAAAYCRQQLASLTARGAGAD